MIHAPARSSLINSGDNAIAVGSFEVSRDEALASESIPPAPDPGDTVRLPIVELTHGEPTWAWVG